MLQGYPGRGSGVGGLPWVERAWGFCSLWPLYAGAWDAWILGGVGSVTPLIVWCFQWSLAVLAWGRDRGCPWDGLGFFYPGVGSLGGLCPGVMWICTNVCKSLLYWPFSFLILPLFYSFFLSISLFVSFICAQKRYKNTGLALCVYI